MLNERAQIVLSVQPLNGEDDRRLVTDALLRLEGVRGVGDDRALAETLAAAAAAAARDGELVGLALIAALREALSGAAASPSPCVVCLEAAAPAQTRPGPRPRASCSAAFGS